MIHRITALFDWALSPRRSPNPRVRAAWWTIVGFLGIGAWLQPLTHRAFIGLWVGTNILYVITAIFWCLIHPRSLVGSREISLRWSVLSTLFASVLIFAQIYTLFDQVRQSTEGANNVPAVVAAITVVACPLVFGLILALGVVGAMVGAFAMRRVQDTRQATRAAVGFWYTAFVLLALWAILFRHHSDTRTLYAFSIPMLTVLYCQFANGSASPIRRAGQYIALWLDRILIVRRTHGRQRKIDLRGAAFGLMAAVLMLVAPTSLIAPLKTLALVTLIKIRTAIPKIDLNDNSLVAQPDQKSDIVILNLDPATRQRILMGSSEAAIQAEIAAKLTAWGARAVVLPTPLVHPKQYVSVTGQPAPDTASIKRCRRDLKLLAAVKGRILLTLPPLHGRLEWRGSDYSAITDPDLAPLYNACLPGRGLQLTRADLPLSDAVHLPIIPEHVRAGEIISAPVALYMAIRKVGTPPSRYIQDSDLSDYVGITLPQITPEGVLVNFLGKGPRYDFTHIDYSTLLRGDSINATPSDADPPLDSSNWETPAQFFHRGQVVLLDSVLHPLVTTPLGVISQSDLLAYATKTLLSGQSIRPIRTVSLVLWTLFTGICIGATCFRRDPLDAIWRATIPMFLIVMVSLLLFVFEGVWLDPVLPLGTAVILLPIVTQLSFAQERNERQRTRALFQRFVASDQLDNWLAMPTDALALGGKRQTVCVLFADVRNFTHFAEQNEADKVIEVINAYMSGLTEELHRHGGVLDKYTGDGLMAWFPVQENNFVSLQNAVNAALAMRDAAGEIGRQMPADEKLEIGFGLHYGDAVVGLVGSEKLQINWTAMGRTVVISARLQTIAGGGEVVISERLYQATAGAFAVSEGEPVMVKGLSAPVRPYRVLNVIPSTDRQAVAHQATMPSQSAPPTAS